MDFLDFSNMINNFPEEFDVVVEIPMGEQNVKYEIDHKTGKLHVDRFLSVAMNYPYNYGFIPNTMTGDGDPCDVLILNHCPLLPGSTITCRPIGILNMTDESGEDKKLLCLPKKKIDLLYSSADSIHDLPKIILNKIEHFFSYYKKLEKEKWVEIGKWEDKSSAIDFIKKSQVN